MLTWEKMTSREKIGKFLLKLPSGIFPSYRCIINVIPVSDRNLSDEIVTSNQHDCSLRCRSCSKLHEDVASSVNIPPPPPFPFHLTSSHVEDVNLRPTITAEALTNVKLRKPKVILHTPITPVRDMMQILKKRYTAMHSPTPKKLSHCDEDDLDD
ncbi:hypothetical protein BDFB_005640 [Asbolus verrucosus]|uniref:Uncharacterized protein n=1 Tax=Asbolus verrucosus TaxID=1661398 RepID=A0A482V1A6_ASBVE|nr:hypothetical protein BDFB_005640 [Asbolus verrucosus]